MGWQDRAYNQENNGGIPPLQFRFPPFTTLTVGIIVVCFFMFVAQSVTKPPLELLMRGETGPVDKWLALDVNGGKAFYQPWRFITYQYLHDGSVHIFWNMLILYFFLPTLEGFWGWRKALAFYTAGGVVAGLAYAALTLIQPSFGLVGASGSIFAALGAVALLSPSRQVWLFFFSIPIRVFAGLIAAFYLLTVIGERNLSNAAHLGGLAFGFFAPMIGGPILHKYKQKYRRMKMQRDAFNEAREQEQIDQILHKVSHQGMQSLTGHEKKVLQRATERQRKQEATKARRGAY